MFSPMGARLPAASRRALRCGAMRLEPREMPGWPPLAWLARCGDDIELWHGPRCRGRGRTGRTKAHGRADFDAGSFDEVAVSLGSGVRIRGDEAVFVSPTSTIDRLCHMVTPAGETLVSNSLLALLQAAGATVTDPKYQARATSIVRGIDRCREYGRDLAGTARLTHFRDLVWSRGRLERRRQADGWRRSLGDFAGISRSSGFGRSRALAANMADPSRRVPAPIPRDALVRLRRQRGDRARRGGRMRAAICFETTGSGHPDSGVPVAKRPGDRTDRHRARRVAVRASAGRRHRGAVPGGRRGERPDRVPWRPRAPLGCCARLGVLRRLDLESGVGALGPTSFARTLPGSASASTASTPASSTAPRRSGPRARWRRSSGSAARPRWSRGCWAPVTTGRFRAGSPRRPASRGRLSDMTSARSPRRSLTGTAGS